MVLFNIYLWFTSAWSNWRPANHIRPETTCKQTHEIIYYFATSYYKLIYFLFSKGFEKKTSFLSRLLLYAQVPLMLLT
jgi:hypothetical protein